MTAISGTRRAMKEMADGTVRVQIDIDPKYRNEFFNLFGQIDMPVALAPLVSDFEKSTSDEADIQQKPKGGDLAKLAGMFCQSVHFWEFCRCDDADEARDWILRVCGVESRRDLDHNPTAAKIFHDRVRKPYLESRK
jgi:hypothetical protein